MIKHSYYIICCVIYGFCIAFLGGPMVFSNPHLLYADPKYGNYVEGLQPDRDLHSSFVVLEPVS